MLVFNVVLHPARNLDWISWSCERRASPTLSSAKAYFSSAVANGSSVALDDCVSWSSCEPAREARAMAWLKVFGCGLADGGAVNAADACEGVEA